MKRKAFLTTLKGVPSAESSHSVRGLGKGVSDKPYPRLCNARRPRLEPGTFRSQTVRFYRLHQAHPSILNNIVLYNIITSSTKIAVQANSRTRGWEPTWPRVQKQTQKNQLDTFNFTDQLINLGNNGWEDLLVSARATAEALHPVTSSNNRQGLHATADPGITGALVQCTTRQLIDWLPRPHFLSFDFSFICNYVS